MSLITVLVLKGSIAIAEYPADTNYYQVFGSTGDELGRELSEKGPNGYIADTEWNIKTRYHYIELGSGCLLDYSNVDLNISYTMPEWVDKLQAPIELQEHWDSWYSKLLSHESNHGANGEKAYEEIQRGFLLLSSAENCGQLQRELDDMTRNTLTRYTQQDAHYDRLTNHGETEGVTRSFANGAE